MKYDRYVKINIDETPEHCAAREVDEEIGYDISPLIDKKDFIEVELSGCEYHKLNDFPSICIC